jgi:hypothetical protein
MPAEDNMNTEQHVTERLKFFFSDANLRQDLFLRKLVMSTEGETPGMVPIEILLKFNSIKQYTTETDVIAKVAREMKDTLTVDEKGTAIGRVTPFTKDLMDGHIPKSLYIRNLPVNDEDPKKAQYAVTIDDIRKLFDKYGDVAIIKLKFGKSKKDEGDDQLEGGKSHGKKKYPIGHVLVEFHDQDSLDKAAEATLTSKDGEKVEPKEKLTLGGKDLDVMLLKDYIDMRKKERENSPKKRDRDDDDEDKEVELPKFEFEWKPGCVIRIKGLSEQTDREAILDMVAKALEISVEEVKAKNVYADFSRGQPDGAIRFAEPEEKIAKICEGLNSGDLEIADFKIGSAEIISGDEEKKYWDDFIAFKNKQIQHNHEEKRSKKNRNKKRRHHR